MAKITFEEPDGKERTVDMANGTRASLEPAQHGYDGSETVANRDHETRGGDQEFSIGGHKPSAYR